MKFFNQHKTSLFLMCASVLLLTLFNAFWLRQNYREQQLTLQKDISNIFEKTTNSMQDSLIKRQVDVAMKTQKPYKINQKTPVIVSKTDQKFTFKSKTSQNVSKKDSVRLENITVISNNRLEKGDSMGKILLTSMIKSLRIDSLQSSIKIEIKLDKLDSNSKQKHKTSNRVWVMANNKAIINNKLPIPPPIEQLRKEGNIIIKLVSDSLKKVEIWQKYQAKLQSQQIDLPFTIATNTKEKTLQAHQIGAKNTLGLFTYQAIFDESRWFLIKKIVPQILFSFFLIAITTLSFLLIYRNLQQQRRLTELKNDFVSNVTHELKTPISTVSVAIEALSNFNVLQNPAQTKEYLEISKNELNRLTILVDKVLKMSIFEQKDLALKIELINFKSLIENVLATMKLQFEKFHAQVDFDFTGNHFTLEGDTIHLTNVVYNLLENALKYSSEPLISIRLEEAKGNIQLKIQDNGIGISEEYLPKIFDKFFRVPTGDVHNTKGYGLGLSYVKSVIEKHNGTIEVSSKIDEGSCFLINIPSSKV